MTMIIEKYFLRENLRMPNFKSMVLIFNLLFSILILFAQPLQGQTNFEKAVRDPLSDHYLGLIYKGAQSPIFGFSKDGKWLLEMTSRAVGFEGAEQMFYTLLSLPDEKH